MAQHALTGYIIDVSIRQDAKLALKAYTLRKRLKI